MAREVVLTDFTVALPEESTLRIEIARQVRFRYIGVWLLTIFALLCFTLVFFSFGMMHYQKDTVTVMGTIIAVERDSQNGEILMTTEFVDADGGVHRDKQTSRYHYARGEPKIGQHIKYIYWRSNLTEDFHSTPRADGILKWTFGSIGAGFSLLAIGCGIYLNRYGRLRRRLIVSGRRERGARYAIESKTTVVGIKVTQIIEQWRLSARYFEDSITGFKDCYSDWQPGLPPDRLNDLTVPMILVDPTDPRRYWLPVGELYERIPPIA